MNANGISKINLTEGLAARTLCAIAAGAISITVNTLVLMFADAIGLVTARGGLLTLLLQTTGMPLSALNTSAFWHQLGIPSPGLYSIQLIFHFVVGIGMSVAYGLVVERFLKGSDLVKGLVYAAALWLANAVIILPLIGQGFAGHSVLTITGIVYFALAHTLFFVLLATLYGVFLRKSGVEAAAISSSVRGI